VTPLWLIVAVQLDNSLLDMISLIMLCIVSKLLKLYFNSYEDTMREWVVMDNLISDWYKVVVTTVTYKDADLYNDMLTGRSVTGVIHLLNQTLIDWFSKGKQQRRSLFKQNKSSRITNNNKNRVCVITTIQPPLFIAIN
jgi:hypothetical protein